MSRLFVFGILVATLSTTGCVGWGPCGNECFRGPFRGTLEGLCSTCPDDCGNCDGYNPPFGNLRRRLACGSGCGEIYYGEWVSNPPNSCNECDARGYAYGINSKYPWLCNGFRGWWRPWGVKYRPNGMGYGNPYRGTHPGIADYGYRPGMLLDGCMTDPCGCSSCASGCTSGCLNGDCAPNAPSGPRLQPIPSHSTSTRNKSGNAIQVNYESPLIRKSRIRTAASRGTSIRPPLPSSKSATSSSQSASGGMRTSAVLRPKNSGAQTNVGSATTGRLKQARSLR